MTPSETLIHGYGLAAERRSAPAAVIDAARRMAPLHFGAGDFGERFQALRMALARLDGIRHAGFNVGWQARGPSLVTMSDLARVRAFQDRLLAERPDLGAEGGPPLPDGLTRRDLKLWCYPTYEAELRKYLPGTRAARSEEAKARGKGKGKGKGRAIPLPDLFAEPTP